MIVLGYFWDPLRFMTVFSGFLGFGTALLGCFGILRDSMKLVGKFLELRRSFWDFLGFRTIFSGFFGI